LQWEVLFLPAGEVTGSFSTLMDSGNGTFTLGYEVRHFVDVSSTPQLAILLDGRQLPNSPWTPAWVASFPASAGKIGVSGFVPDVGLLSGPLEAGVLAAVGRVSLLDQFGNPVSGSEHAALLTGTAEPASTDLLSAINPIAAPVRRDLIFEVEDDGAYAVSLYVEVRRE
jgi:hypothetical protein